MNILNEIYMYKGCGSKNCILDIVVDTKNNIFWCSFPSFWMFMTVIFIFISLLLITQFYISTTS